MLCEHCMCNENIMNVIQTSFLPKEADGWHLYEVLSGRHYPEWFRESKTIQSNHRAIKETEGDTSVIKLSLIDHKQDHCKKKKKIDKP